MHKEHLLVIEDDKVVSFSLKHFLQDSGYRVDTMASGIEGWNLIKTKRYPLILSDINLPGMDGIEILDKIKEEKVTSELILFTGFGTIQNAVDCIKKGAYDYLTKPIDNDRLLVAIRRALEHKALKDENRGLREKLAKTSQAQIVFRSKKMQELLDKAKIVAQTNVTILITGESGTGKTLLAKFIHNHSKKRLRPFVEVSCGALSENLLESELFGHKKGAFTGAVSNKKGKFEASKDGTVLLDDINSASTGLQVKLLRVIEQKVYELVGDTQTRKTDARIIAATNKDLLGLCERRLFREDLFHRLNVVSFEIPSLRERKEDIPVLIQHFFTRCSNKYDKAINTINDSVLRILCDYSWPGNARELENTIEQIVIFSQNNRIQRSDLPKYILNSTRSDKTAIINDDDLNLSRVTEKLEKLHILKVLEKNSGNRNNTAKVLGISRATLFNKMTKYGILGNKK
jgi:DNA-binding NtrC family response regulator